jgi:hypothetical protein
MNDQVLYLERPSFWTEERDPECWYRGLKALAELEKEEGVIRGTPRSLWERYLKPVLSRRSILGLFGMAPDYSQNFLLGVGFLEYHPDKKGWAIAAFSKSLVAGDLQNQLDDPEALKRLAAALLERSPWLRLLVMRLMLGDWALAEWRSLRDGRGKLQAGSSLILHRHSEQEDWFAGIEHFCADRWFPYDHPATAIRLHPDVMSRDSRRDDFSWAPFKAPLYLFDYLGWLVGDGDLRIPADVLKTTGFKGCNHSSIDATALLREITEREADLRGFVAVEKALRELYAMIHPDQNTNVDEFALWMDALMSCAMEKGAIEILAAEPGQARHGRGLFGDRQRKLARWVVHADFNDCFAQINQKVAGINPQDPHAGHDNQTERGPIL